MNKLHGYYGKISKVEVIDIATSKVFFEGGSTHVISNSPYLKVGNIVVVDTYGSLWVKV